ncbi:hypothetical protein BjapCC829_07905 [Bradyrhizobium barranii]|uniref:Uncharacterized protein n=1 Tax=Bradyrhizobium barranii TaxID=2992140 RepID=A0ABY3QQY5_9BRAD|nr:hypothetical protein [Bradyrhizobium japonicum]UFW88429.1 hypothetical protein BjapCC829_07905 [Bradyrhizobium japonicum]
MAAAIDRLDVGRIDHGVQCEADPRLMRRLAREGHCPCGVPTLKVLKVFPPRRAQTSRLCMLGSTSRSTPTTRHISGVLGRHSLSDRRRQWA